MTVPPQRPQKKPNKTETNPLGYGRGGRLLSLHLAAYRLRAVGASGHGAIDALDLKGGPGQGLPGAVPDLQSDGENVGGGIVAQGKGCYLQTLG